MGIHWAFKGWLLGSLHWLLGIEPAKAGCLEASIGYWPLSLYWLAARCSAMAFLPFCCTCWKVSEVFWRQVLHRWHFAKLHVILHFSQCALKLTFRKAHVATDATHEVIQWFPLHPSWYGKNLLHMVMFFVLEAQPKTRRSAVLQARWWHASRSWCHPCGPKSWGRRCIPQSHYC